MSVLIWNLSASSKMPCQCEFKDTLSELSMGGLCNITGYTIKSKLLVDEEADRPDCLTWPDIWQGEYYGGYYKHDWPYRTDYTLYCLNGDVRSQSVGIPFLWIAQFVVGGTVLIALIIYILYCILYVLVWCLVSGLSKFPKPTNVLSNGITGTINEVIKWHQNWQNTQFLLILVQILNFIAVLGIIVLLYVYDETIFSSSSGSCKIYDEYYTTSEPFTKTWDPWFKHMIIDGKLRTLLILYLVTLLFAMCSRRIVYVIMKRSDYSKSKSLLFRYFVIKQHYAKGVKVITISAGDAKNYPKKGDNVTVQLVETFHLGDKDGETYSSLQKRNKPCTFQIGKGSIIRGLREGVLKMSLGERSVFEISHEYGYGKYGGLNGVVPWKQDLKIEVELLKIN
eukprot:367195_1